MGHTERLEITVSAGEIHCSACESRIEAALGKLPGVATVKADYKTQKIVLLLDQERTPMDEVLARVDFLGYSIAHGPELSPAPYLAEGSQIPPARQGLAKTGRWSTACNCCTGVVSVICMSSMGAAMGAAGSAGAAAAVGMAGMSGMETGSSAASGLAPLPRLFEDIGLGFLNHVPNEVAQPVLVAFLAISAAAAYVAYRGHGRAAVLALTLASGIAMYLSIYAWMSEALYFLSLGGLLGAAASNFSSLRPRRRAASGHQG